MNTIEIERKFLVRNGDWINHVIQATCILQWYIHSDPHKSIRIRVEEGSAIMCMKSLISNCARREYHFDISMEDAMAMLGDTQLMQGRPVTKIRHIVIHDGERWEIDQFTGDNAGLVVAELELKAAASMFAVPSWIGAEVTASPEYLNSSLAERPFKFW